MDQDAAMRIYTCQYASAGGPRLEVRSVFKVLDLTLISDLVRVTLRQNAAAFVERDASSHHDQDVRYTADSGRPWPKLPGGRRDVQSPGSGLAQFRWVRSACWP